MSICVLCLWECVCLSAHICMYIKYCCMPFVCGVPALVRLSFYIKCVELSHIYTNIGMHMCIPLGKSYYSY